VVGGGPVGERKVRSLRECGARVTVVSPTLTPALARLAARERIAWRRRTFRPSDVRRAAVVIAATGRPAVDRAVARAARRQRALVNAVDRPDLCDFIVPSVLRRGNLQVAVSTGGRSPALARAVRELLEPLFPPGIGALVERAGRTRRILPVTVPARRAAAERLADRVMQALRRPIARR
jgi:precorrin-2 dehydrogenase/sirohydrochlorin ferrochelatase